MASFKLSGFCLLFSAYGGYQVSCDSQMCGVYLRGYDVCTEQYRLLFSSLLVAAACRLAWGVMQITTFTKTFLFLGMYQSFRPEQSSYSFPWKQVDPGAKGLLHRNELKDLYGKYVCDTVKPTHCFWVLQFNQIAACSSPRRIEFWYQIFSKLCSSLSRKEAA